MAHLITGYAGYEHIQSEDDGAFNAAVMGDGQYVMESGNQFAGSIIDNNTVRILDGEGLMYGRHFRIKPNSFEDLVITTGTAGMNRIDLICMTYEKNATDETESVYLQVIKGTETTGTATKPEYTDGDILNGATFNQMPLYSVKIQGVVLAGITQLFEVVPTYKTLAEKYEDQFKEACDAHLQTFLDLAYPVGSIYMSANNVNPGTLFGGTWTSWGAGRVPVGVDTSDSDFNTVEKTGGASTHTLSSGEMPSHAHGLNSHTHTIPAHSHGLNNHTHSVPNHTHTLTETGSSGIILLASDGTGVSVPQLSSGTIKTNSSGACTTGAASGNTENSSVLTSGAASGNTASTGSGSAHNNLQPYITCYMWKRTA